MKTIKKILLSPYALLFLLCFIPEAVFLGKHGFYWDDWSQIFLHTRYGNAMFWPYFSNSRPTSAWTQIMGFITCGTSAVKWHILYLLLKYSLLIVLRAVMLRIFPGKGRIIETAVILYAVCPIFSQEYVAMTYIQHFADYPLFFFSAYALLRASSADKQKNMLLWYAASVITMILHLTITEFFAFLEILKPLMLWLYLQNRNEEKPLHKTVRYALPHFLLFLLYCLYRAKIDLFFPNFNAEMPYLMYMLRDDFFGALRTLIRNMSIDLVYPVTGFISRLMDYDLEHILSFHELMTALISLFLAVCAFIGISGRFQKITDGKKIWQVILFGLLGIPLGILPFWILNENILFTDDPIHADRIFLAASPFLCLIYSVIISFFFNEKKRYATAVSLIVFIFVHSQLDSSQFGAVSTIRQNAFYNQLLERMPGIESGTAIVDDTIMFPEQGNFATASALNLLYGNPIMDNGDVPIWAFSYDKRLYQDHGGFHVQNRIYHFNQSPANYIYIEHDNKFSNCVWVLGPEDTDNPHVSDLQRTWIEHSNLSRIQLDAEGAGNKELFGTIEDGWCKYYEKAAYLRQKEQWEDLQALAHEALDRGFTPSDNRSNAPFEWWPFIEGLYRMGETDLAESIADEAIRTDAAYDAFFAGRLKDLGSR